MRLTFGAEVEAVALSIEDEVIGMYSGPEVRDILAAAPGEGTPAVAFEVYEDISRPVDWPEPWSAPRELLLLLFAKCRQLLRDAENAHRADAGIPLVGQGWVSELTLFRDLQAAFPEERIVHQGRPYWLGRQTLDIFFPDRIVGVEYQGTQHSKPVDFFGGADAYERQRERDLRKRGICERNECELITVHTGYVLRDVVDEVSAALHRDDRGD